MKLLFIPVSAPRGFGEYARTRQIALAAAARWPAAQIRFVLSRAASYASSCPFPATLLPASATFHSREVIALLQQFRPDLVLFDNAGRSAQIRAAHHLGARVVYVSSRRRQRTRAFRLGLLRSIDEHWIAYPEFVAGRLGVLERLKLRLPGGPRIRYLDTILPEPAPSGPEPAIPPAADQSGPGMVEIVPYLGAGARPFVLVVPGGGTPHPGAEDAPATVARAAAQIAARGWQTLLVGVVRPADAPAQLHAIARRPLEELAALLRAAALVITNGGDTLLQALACARPCVACAIAPDQAPRIAHLAGLGLITAAPLDARALADAATALLADSQRQRAQLAALAAHPVHNALPEVLAAIGALTGAAQTDSVRTDSAAAAARPDEDEARLPERPAPGRQP
ncbi:MAG TPA: hypothetical protein VMB48_03070 [Steroidobacteraceae bacterium]|nr:hypothetical protein [Steroidobacteraceae bacterium]